MSCGQWTFDETLQLYTSATHAAASGTPKTSSATLLPLLLLLLLGLLQLCRCQRCRHHVLLLQHLHFECSRLLLLAVRLPLRAELLSETLLLLLGALKLRPQRGLVGGVAEHAEQ
jgi:hypothetical protein